MAAVDERLEFDMRVGIDEPRDQDLVFERGVDRKRRKGESFKRWRMSSSSPTAKIRRSITATAAAKGCSSSGDDPAGGIYGGPRVHEPPLGGRVVRNLAGPSFGIASPPA
jgi:hypothetical protein